MLRWKCLPVEIRWYSGGENVIDPYGVMDTESVIRTDRLCHQMGFSVNDFRGIL